MKYLLALIGLFAAGMIKSQTISDFESLNIPPAGYLNGKDMSGGFKDGNVFLPNTFTAQFDSWSGWAISNITDNVTPGYNNQYSAITGSGFEGSKTYAVSYVIGTSKLILQGDAKGGIVNGLYVTNSTYAALSMKNGDAFSKAFGGISGKDPDFFILTIKKWYNNVLSNDSINFYLADFRFEDSTKDYFINKWTYIDLSKLGRVDSLQFSLSSSDNGAFGMNTPSYFCLDQISTADGLVNIEEHVKAKEVLFYPNIVSEKLYFQEPVKNVIIFNKIGTKVFESETYVNEIDVSNLIIGNYFVWLKNKSYFFQKI